MRERWKQAFWILVSAAVVLSVAFASLVLLNTYPNLLMLHPGDFEGQVELAIVCVAIYLAAVRWIERRPATELSPHHALQSLAAGLLGGIALVSLIIEILWIVGVFQPEKAGAFGALGRGFVYMLAVAVREEIMYRGVMFRLCSKIVGTWGALLVSAAWFAASHATNPGATTTGLLVIALAGVLFGAAYTATGRLWLPIGLHLGWNFAEGSIFGTVVSGHDIGPSLIQGTMHGPNIWTGGEFGPEASIAGLAVTLAVTAYFVWRIAKLERAEPPIWSDAGRARVTTAAA
jgi:uncharacterized protein